MRTFNLYFTGLFGNRIYQYVFARAYCETHGYELRTEPWVGEKLFQVFTSPIHADYREPIGETELLKGPQDGDVHFRSYCQSQPCIDYYTRTKARAWLGWRPHIREWLQELGAMPPLMAHMRRGDYQSAGYVLVSKQSYLDACVKFGFDPEALFFSTEENPLSSPHFTTPHFGVNDTMTPDFWRLCQAEVLFRGNSSFSWWAAVLGKAQVFSPVVTGKTGGVEQHCEFVAGNYPRLCDLGFVHNLHLAP